MIGMVMQALRYVSFRIEGDFLSLVYGLANPTEHGVVFTMRKRTPTMQYAIDPRLMHDMIGQKGI